MTATQWLEVLVSYSLQVVTVIAAGSLLERAVARSSDRCTIWNICFFSVLILGCGALLLPRLHLIQPWSRVEPRTLLTVSAAQAVIGRCLLAVWCIGASVSLIRWMVRGRLVRGILRRCECLPSTDVQRLLGPTNSADDCLDQLAVLISDETEGPFCWQLHQPTVVLPRFLLEGGTDDLRHVLLHEIEHLKTNHPIHLFWQQLAQVVCWFHPAVWNAGSRATLMREFMCDEAAASEGADVAGYLRTLLHIAERCEQKRNPSAIGFGRTSSEIVLRARRLVKLANGAGQPSQRGWLGRKGVSFILTGVTVLAFFLWIPTDPLASSRSVWSPWPKWTAESLHCFGCNLRDYEQYDRRTQLYEIMQDASQKTLAPQLPPAQQSADI